MKTATWILLTVGLCLAALALGWSLRAQRQPAAPARTIPAVVTTSATVVAPAAAQSPRPGSATRPDLSPAVAAFCDQGNPDRLTGDLPARIGRLERPADLAAVAAVLQDPGETDGIRNEAINLLRDAHWPGLDGLLERLLRDPAEAERFRAFLAQHLGLSLQEAEEPARRSRLTGLLQDALADRHPEVRREALLALVRERDSSTVQRLEGMLVDPAAGWASDLVITCLQDLDRRDLAGRILPFTSAKDLPTRIAALIALAHWGEEAVRPALEEAARSVVPRLQRAGTLGLETLDRTVPTGSRSATGP